MSAAATPALSLVKVDKRFPGVHALKDVSIDIRPGEVVGLIGENGAGKSTLMKILSGVYQPDSGEILLAGKPTRFVSSADANRQGIGMVFQEQSLLTNLTVGENVYLGNEAQFTRARHRQLAGALRRGGAPARQGRGRHRPARRRPPISASPRGRWSSSPRR